MATGQATVLPSHQAPRAFQDTARERWNLPPALGRTVRAAWQPGAAVVQVSGAESPPSPYHALTGGRSSVSKAAVRYDRPWSSGWPPGTATHHLIRRVMLGSIDHRGQSSTHSSKLRSPDVLPEPWAGGQEVLSVASTTQPVAQRGARRVQHAKHNVRDWQYGLGFTPRSALKDEAMEKLPREAGKRAVSRRTQRPVW